MYSVIFNRVEYDFSYKETVGYFSTKEKAEEVCNFINSNLKSALEVFNNLPEHLKEDLSHYGKYRYFSDERKSEIDKILKNLCSNCNSIYVQKYFKEVRIDEYYLENSFAEVKECIVDNFDKNNFNI